MVTQNPYDVTFFVVDRDSADYQNLKGQWVKNRELAQLVRQPAPGDLIRDVLYVSVKGDDVIVRSDADDYRNRVSIGFRVSWGDQYEQGAELEVTRQWFRQIVTGEDDTDSNGVWYGRYFDWSCETDAEGQEFPIRTFIFDSRKA